MRWFVLILMLASNSVMAEEIIIHTLSYHTAQRDKLARRHAMNEHNYGVGIKTNSFITGFYKNSEYNISMYLLKYKQIDKFSINYGLVAGYKENRVLPFISCSYELNNLVLSVSPARTIEGNPLAVVHMAFKFKL